MHLRPTDYVLWLAAPLMQVGILYAMYKRSLYRDYPYFFNYTILQVVSFIFLFAFQHFSYPLYFYSYWVSVALDALVSFFVLQEIFKDAFRPYEALRDLSVILFRWSALIVLLVGGMAAVTTSHPSQIDVLNTILMGDRSIRLMQCGLVFFLLLFSEYLGISRRNAVFGIAFGFGLFASVKMLALLGAAHPDVIKATVLRWANTGVYDVAVAIWLAYAIFSEPSRSSVVVPSPIRTKVWDNALQEARISTSPESMLDVMEDKVERLLYPREEGHGVAAGKAS